jgi:hypothetical protein
MTWGNKRGKWVVKTKCNNSGQIEDNRWGQLKK